MIQARSATGRDGGTYVVARSGRVVRDVGKGERRVVPRLTTALLAALALGLRRLLARRRLGEPVDVADLVLEHHGRRDGDDATGTSRGRCAAAGRRAARPGRRGRRAARRARAGERLDVNGGSRDGAPLGRGRRLVRVGRQARLADGGDARAGGVGRRDGGSVIVDCAKCGTKGGDWRAGRGRRGLLASGGGEAEGGGPGGGC